MISQQHCDDHKGGNSPKINGQQLPTGIRRPQQGQFPLGQQIPPNQQERFQQKAQNGQWRFGPQHQRNANNQPINGQNIPQTATRV